MSLLDSGACGAVRSVLRLDDGAVFRCRAASRWPHQRRLGAIAQPRTTSPTSSCARCATSRRVSPCAVDRLDKFHFGNHRLSVLNRAQGLHRTHFANVGGGVGALLSQYPTRCWTPEVANRHDPYFATTGDDWLQQRGVKFQYVTSLTGRTFRKTATFVSPASSRRWTTSFRR